MRTENTMCPSCGGPKKHSSALCRRCYLARTDKKPCKTGDGPNLGGLCMCGCGERAPLAKCSDASVGHIIGKPIRYCYGHARRKSGIRYIVNPDTGCWEWQGAKGPFGHGSMRRGGVCRGAHVWYYEDRFGPVSEGIDLHHVCENPGCVNPEHLQPIPHGEHRKLHPRKRASI